MPNIALCYCQLFPWYSVLFKNFGAIEVLIKKEILVWVSCLYRNHSLVGVTVRKY